jgi:predicted transcriptional regulator
MGLMMMENFNSLLFELSGNDRLDILMLLKKNPLKLSYISRKLNFTVQETSRNIARLSEAKLIVKDVDGAFHLTLYGEEALSQLSGFRFLFKNRDHFLTHSLSALPKQFQSSIGTLEGCELVDDVMISFRNIEEMIARAQDRVRILTNQVLASTIPYLTQAIERGAEFKLLLPKDYLPTKSIREVISDPVFEKAARVKKLDMRFLGKLGAFLCLSEKEVAAIGFPSLEGKFDYSGFKGKTDLVMEWANSLFMHYWNEATSQIPEQIFSP